MKIQVLIYILLFPVKKNMLYRTYKN